MKTQPHVNPYDSGEQSQPTSPAWLRGWDDAWNDHWANPDGHDKKEYQAGYDAANAAQEK